MQGISKKGAITGNKVLSLFISATGFWIILQYLTLGAVGGITLASAGPWVVLLLIIWFIILKK